jgi:N4-gp56 family major capsid protein
MSLQYKTGEVGSSIGKQVNTAFFDRKAMFESRQERHFLQYADVRTMPKHFGKKIESYHMMPLLDDRNINDQGIDAAGATTGTAAWTVTDLTRNVTETFTVEQDADDRVNALGGTAVKTVVAADDNNGNLYGSSKDIGKIKDKLPLISENGGRYNRVGFTRLKIEGTMDNYGMFHEFTEDLLNFDTMNDLYENISRELITGAIQITEAMLQIDLIDAAATIRYAGGAVSKSTVSGETGNVCTVSFEDLQKLNIALDDNRTPKSMTMIKGSSKFDTVTVGAGRLLYIGSEMITTMMGMLDTFGNPAFVSVEHYGYAGSHKEGTGMLHGEIGKIGAFRIIVHPQMLHEAAAGAPVTANDGYRESAGKYDIFPLVSVGSGSFTTIGFQTGGGTDFKFKIITRMPGEIVTLDDPYAKTGFSSLQFWYGFMPLRAERISVLWSVAEL